MKQGIPGLANTLSISRRMSIMGQDGGVLLHVGGRVRVGGSGPLAMGPQGAGPPTAFAEAFVLQPSARGGGCIIRQMFRFLGPGLGLP